MRLVSKFFQLDQTRRRFLLSASFLEISFWFLLRILPFPTVNSLMEKLVAGAKFYQPARKDILQPAIWALTIASRKLLGKDTCLPQAMAARVMFARLGFPVEIKFGVKKSANGDLQAHAWVFHQDQVLIGGEGLDLSSYTPLNRVHRTLL
jgi:hypothetical protein